MQMRRYIVLPLFTAFLCGSTVQSGLAGDAPSSKSASGEGAQPGALHKGKHRDQVGEMMLELLTPEQKVQAQAIMDQAAPLQGQLRKQLHDLRAKSESGTLDQAAQDKLASVRKEMVSSYKATHEKIQNLMTADQKKQCDDKLQEMRASRQASDDGPGGSVAHGSPHQ
ncbi:MAG: hypothetical protein ACRD3W_31950 [Terriglobales bacterium]